MPEIEIKKLLTINVDSVSLEGELIIPPNARGLVLFVHGSGSSRFSPRNNFVAKVLQQNYLATFLVDLLTQKEDLDYDYRFNIDLLSQRLVKITNFLKENDDAKDLEIGYFGASTGAAAAIKAAAIEQNDIAAIVSRGGRVDLAENELQKITAPTLLIVGERDDFVVDVNKDALKKLKFTKKISIISDATHLFEEPGALDQVAQQATEWFSTYLRGK